MEAIRIEGWNGVKWTTVNYPDGKAYALRLTVTDGEGRVSPPVYVGIYIHNQPVKPNTKKNLPTPPPGMKWGTDIHGSDVLVKDSTKFVKSFFYTLPPTGQLMIWAAPLVLLVLGMGAAFVLLRRRAAARA